LKINIKIEIFCSSDETWEAQSKISFIEHQIKLCENVNSHQELKHWYSTLGYYLATHGTEKKVRQILDELLGPIFSLQNDAECRAKHTILNISKHDLLQEVLTHFKASTKWQRIYCEYSDQLKEMEASAKPQTMDTS
jgi:protein HIRA/HIR1